MTEEADLAVLTASLPAQPSPVSDLAAVAAFLAQHGIDRGGARGVMVCTLYRLYLTWYEGQTEGLRKVNPKSFSRQLRLMGFKKKHDRGRLAAVDTMVILVNVVAAKFLREWRTRHPDSPEYRLWFKKHSGRLLG